MRVGGCKMGGRRGEEQGGRGIGTGRKKDKGPGYMIWGMEQRRECPLPGPPPPFTPFSCPPSSCLSLSSTFPSLPLPPLEILPSLFPFSHTLPPYTPTLPFYHPLQSLSLTTFRSVNSGQCSAGSPPPSSPAWFMVYAGSN